MPNFLTQTPVPAGAPLAARLRAFESRIIARDGETVTILRRNDTAGGADYSQPVPCNVSPISLDAAEMLIEGDNNLNAAKAHKFEFEGGWDIRGTDKILYNGDIMRILQANPLRRQGVTVRLDCLAVMEKAAS